jgi:hypothetical protein
MLKYNEIYKKVNNDRVTDNSVFDSDYMKHQVDQDQEV